MRAKRFIGWMILSMAACLALGAAATVYAQQGVELGGGVTVTAEVVGIDKVDRTVELLGPEGNVVEVQVGHEARNFDQIQVGDKVKVTYYESVALFVGKPGEKPEAGAGLLVARAAKGEMPGGVVVKAVDVRATIEKINEKKRELTLKLPDGKKMKTKVDKSVQGFESLKVGDSINVRYTQALAISVEKV